MVPFAEIEKNDYNLNLPRYIDSQQAEDSQDIEGHLKGGIPLADVDALQRYWEVCPDLRKALFKPNRPGYVDLAVDKAAIKPTIYEHPQFAAFIDGMNTHFDRWRKKSAATLKSLDAGCHPKDVIADLSEKLLAHYTSQPLINGYDVYQHLMDYWAETMQDDLYLIAADGWKASTYRVIEQKKNKDGKVTKEVDRGWACDLLPKSLIVARYFAAEQAAIDQLAADGEATEAQLTELEEEHGGEDAVFSGFDKINAKAVKERLDEIGDDREARDEIAVLKRWRKLDREKAELKKKLKEAEAALDAATYAKYPQLSQAEIKTLAVDDKWLGALDTAIHGEMERISQGLTRRVRELEERYETRLPLLVNRVAELQVKVDAHLERMGFAWR
jgi:type I restriction enzyme M protein